jgi:hypothetical protein
MPTSRPISIQEEESQRRVAMVFHLVGTAHRAGVTTLSIHRAVDLVSRMTLKAGARDVFTALAREKPETWQGRDDEDRKRDRDALHRAVLRARKAAGEQPLQRGRKKQDAQGPNHIFEPTDLGLPEDPLAQDDLAVNDPLETELARLREGVDHLFRVRDPDLADRAVRVPRKGEDLIGAM